MERNPCYVCHGQHCIYISLAESGVILTDHKCWVSGVAMVPDEPNEARPSHLGGGLRACWPPLVGAP